MRSRFLVENNWLGFSWTFLEWTTLHFLDLLTLWLRSCSFRLALSCRSFLLVTLLLDVYSLLSTQYLVIDRTHVHVQYYTSIVISMILHEMTTSSKPAI